MNAVKQPDSLKAMKVFGVFTVLVMIVAVFRMLDFRGKEIS